jgi:Methylenetetrahydrofolate reductase
MYSILHIIICSIHNVLICCTVLCTAQNDFISVNIDYTILGMMPIQSYSSFERMTQHCRTTVPPYIWEHLLPIRDDDEAVKAYGVEVCVNMCNVLSKAGIPGFHFYTLNLEKSVLAVLKGLNIEESAAARRCALYCYCLLPHCILLTVL